MIESEDLVSIITPAHNAARYIEDAIRSVRAQSYPHWEMLITDDASTDDTVEMIHRYQQMDERIHCFPLLCCVGAANARNNSLEHAHGKYVAFLDSDDMWSPDKLERQIAFMKEGGYAFTFTNYVAVDETGKRIVHTLHMPAMLTYRSYLRNTAIGCLTVMIDRSQIGDVDMPDIRSSHDMALWLAILKRGFKAYSLREVLASYRLVPNSNTAGKWRAARDVWRVYRNIEHLNPLYSAYNFCGYALHAVLKRL